MDLSLTTRLPWPAMERSFLPNPFLFNHSIHNPKMAEFQSMSSWKKVSTLNNEDFVTCPVWKFEYRKECEDHDDYDVILNREKTQEWALPAPEVISLTDRGGSFIVRSKFLLADGTEFFGFCSPSDPSGIDYTQPVMITARGHIRFWYDWKPDWVEPLRSLHKLGKDASKVFPVECVSLIPCDGEKYRVFLEEIYVPAW